MMRDAETRLLILSAWNPEQRLLRRLLGHPESHGELTFSPFELAQEACLRTRYGEEPLRRLGQMVDFCCIGVGVFQSLEFLCSHLLHWQKQNGSGPALCFTGTAGLVGRSFAEPFACRVKAVYWYDRTHSRGQSYVPPQMEQELFFTSDSTHDQKVTEALPRCAATPGQDSTTPVEESDTHQFVCLGTFGITRDASDDLQMCEHLIERFRLSDSVTFVENLELYAVARAANRFGLSWQAELGISNETGPCAHQQWTSHHLVASCLAQERLLESLLRP
jgi:hypothetical protein